MLFAPANAAHIAWLIISLAAKLARQIRKAAADPLWSCAAASRSCRRPTVQGGTLSISQHRQAVCGGPDRKRRQTDILEVIRGDGEGARASAVQDHVFQHPLASAPARLATAGRSADPASDSAGPIRSPSTPISNRCRSGPSSPCCGVCSASRGNRSISTKRRNRAPILGRSGRGKQLLRRCKPAQVMAAE
jgi:hypothetical protein